MRLLFALFTAVAIFIIAGILVLSGMSMRSSAGRLHASVEIARSPEEIWPWLREGSKTKQWVSSLSEVRPAGENKEVWILQDPNNNGQRMEVEGTVVRSDYPRSMTLHLRSPGSFEGDQTYSLAATPNGSTRVDVESTFRFDSSVARLLEPLISKGAGRKLEGDLRNLKTAVEKQPNN